MRRLECFRQQSDGMRRRLQFSFNDHNHQVSHLHAIWGAGMKCPILIGQSSILGSTVGSEPEAVNLSSKIPNR
jgi:hypothetical protein